MEAMSSCLQDFTATSAEATNSRMANHRQSDKPKRQHTCVTCGRSFTKRSDLTRHERVHTGEKPFKCESCGASFSQASSLKSHNRRHTGERPFKCQYCSRSFVHSHRLKSHMLKFHPLRPPDHQDVSRSCGVQCDCCSDLENWVSSCTITCKNNLHSSDSLRKEVQRNRAESGDHRAQEAFSEQDVFRNDANSFENSIRCDKSPTVPPKLGNKNDRIKSSQSMLDGSVTKSEKPLQLKVTSDESLLMCDVCGSFHDDVKSLRHHLETHNKNTLLKCDSCDGRFPSQSSLERHLVIHSTRHTFECSDCEAFFTSSEKLEIHKIMHTGTDKDKLPLLSDYNIEVVGCHSQSLKLHSNVSDDSCSDTGSCTCNCRVSFEKNVSGHGKPFSSLEAFQFSKLQQTGFKLDEYKVLSSSCCSVFVVQKAQINQGLRVTTQTQTDFKHGQSELSMKTMLELDSVDLSSHNYNNNPIVHESGNGVDRRNWLYHGRDGVTGGDMSVNSPLTSLLNTVESFSSFQDQFLTESDTIASLREKIAVESQSALPYEPFAPDTFTPFMSQNLHHDSQELTARQGNDLPLSNQHLVEYAQEPPMPLLQTSPFSSSSVTTVNKERPQALAEINPNFMEEGSTRDVSRSYAADDSQFQTGPSEMVNPFTPFQSSPNLDKANDSFRMFSDKSPSVKESQTDKLHPLPLSELMDSLLDDQINISPTMDLSSVTQELSMRIGNNGTDSIPTVQNGSSISIHSSQLLTNNSNGLTVQEVAGSSPDFLMPRDYTTAFISNSNNFFHRNTERTITTDVTVNDNQAKDVNNSETFLSFGDHNLISEVEPTFYDSNKMVVSHNLSQTNEEQSIGADTNASDHHLKEGNNADAFLPIGGHNMMSDIQPIAYDSTRIISFNGNSSETNENESVGTDIVNSKCNLFKNDKTGKHLTIEDHSFMSEVQPAVDDGNKLLFSHYSSQTNERGRVGMDVQGSYNHPRECDSENFSTVRGHNSMAELQLADYCEKQTNSPKVADNFITFTESALLQGSVSPGNNGPLSTSKDNKQLLPSISSSSSSSVGERAEALGKTLSATLRDTSSGTKHPEDDAGDGKLKGVPGHHQQSHQEKDLKCANCPLGLFDESVISVLCEDECFGDMVERKLRSEEDRSEASHENEETPLQPESSENKVFPSNQNKIEVKEPTSGVEVATLSTRDSGREDKGSPSLTIEQVGTEANQQGKNDMLALSSISGVSLIDDSIAILPSLTDVKDPNNTSRVPFDDNPSSNPDDNQKKPDQILTTTASNTMFKEQPPLIKRPIEPAIPSSNQLGQELLNGTQPVFKVTDDSTNGPSSSHNLSLSSACQSQQSSTLHDEDRKGVAFFSSHSSVKKQRLIRLYKKREKTHPFFKAKHDTCTRITVKKKQTSRRILTVGHFKHGKLKTGLGDKTGFQAHLRPRPRQRFTCHLCKTTFHQFSKLKQHQKHHSQQHPQTCPMCHLSFVFQNMLGNDCKAQFGNANTSVKELEEKGSGAGFGADSDIISADVGSVSEAGFSSSVSSNDPDLSGNDRRNLSSDQKKEGYLCQFCGESLTSLRSLNHHVSRHGQEKPYNCDICPSKFTKKSNLVKHLGIHKGERPYKCDICGKSFTQMANLHVHKRIHTGERPFSCETCQASFAHSQALKLHMRFHAKDTRFACPICQKGFVVKAALEKHLQSHTGEKPYACEACGTSLSSKSSLSRHVKKHKLEQERLPFSCPVCSSRFAQPGHLKLHMKMHSASSPGWSQT